VSRSYDHLTREQLLEILQRRDLDAPYGLVWERDEIEPEAAINRDYVGLRLDPALSCGDAPWRNLVVEGDNWDALRALAATHKGQVKLIYIDPPYNTGRRDFVYNDRYFDKTNRYRHSTWLEFMHKRLMLARELLAPDGAIFVSIDDNELFNLGLLMNKVFGEQSFIANCIWQKRYSRENREAIGDAHEYLLVYSPNPELFKVRRGKIPLTGKQAAAYKNPNNDPRGPWQSISLSAQGWRPNQMYEITAPNGKRHTPPEGRCWATIEAEYLKLREQGRITFGSDGNGVPRVIRYLSEVEGVVPWTWWPHEEVGHTDEAKKDIQAIFGTQTAFDTPKPLRLMERILRIASRPGDLVLDFFAGSGTFGQAVLQLNAEDGGDRRFILVSNREATAEEPDKNLCRDICAERLRRYLAKVGAGGTASGFAYAVAERLPRHRMVEKLADALVWSFAQLAHDHPLTLFARPLAHSVRGDHLLLYAHGAGARAASAVEKALADHAGPATLYTWSPEQYADLPSRVVVTVPDALLAAFRRGEAGAARVVARANEAPLENPAGGL
jgi:adenine-specific DNA-methyltransferase